VPNLFSYPSTTPAWQPASTRQVEVLTGQVQINLDAAPRLFATGSVVNLNDHEYAGIASTLFSSGYLQDRGSMRTVADDDHLRVVEIPFRLPAIANGTIGGFKLPFAGQIREVRFVDLDPATTASKASTLTLKLGTKLVGTNEKVTLTGGGTGLTSYTLTFGGQTTASIAAAANATAIRQALEALSTIGVGNVLVTGGPVTSTPVQITFTGALGGTDVGNVTTTPTGGTGTVTPTVPTTGGALTLALTTADLDTEGKVVVSGGSFTSGDANFTADTSLTVIAASTTAFVEGRGMLQIVCSTV